MGTRETTGRSAASADRKMPPASPVGRDGGQKFSLSHTPRAAAPLQAAQISHFIVCRFPRPSLTSGSRPVGEPRPAGQCRAPRCDDGRGPHLDPLNWGARRWSTGHSTCLSARRAYCATPPASGRRGRRSATNLSGARTRARAYIVPLDDDRRLLARPSGARPPPETRAPPVARPEPDAGRCSGSELATDFGAPDRGRTVAASSAAADWRPAADRAGLPLAPAAD
jgi:hypothetical protein